MEHIELKLKLVRDLKSKVMIVPRGTHLEGAGAGLGVNVPRGTYLEGVESVPTNVPRGTHKSAGVNVPRGTSKSLVTIPVTDFLNTVSIRGNLGNEIHVIIKDADFVIAHCKIVAGVASVVSNGWAGRSYDLLGLLREVGY